MRMSHMLGGVLAIVLLTGSTFAEGVKSGPQVGSKRIPPFNPLHCNGDDTGGKSCLV
jgi:hypothetical protein